MAFSITKIALDSFKTLYQNKSVFWISVAYAIVVGTIGYLIALGITPLATQLKSLVAEWFHGQIYFYELFPVLSPLIGIAVGGGLISYLITVFARGAVISAAYDSKKSIDAAVSQTLSRYFWFLFTYIVLVILIAIGLILFVIPGIYIGIKLAVAPVETLINKKGVIESLKASWAETGNNWWNVFFTFLVVEILIAIFSLISAVFSIISIGAVITAILGTFIKMSIDVARVRMYQSLVRATKASQKRK